MPDAIDIARARLDYFRSEETPAHRGTPPTNPEFADASGGLFGSDGLSFRDVLDAINPLNHIPIVSDMFASATGHQASAASKLVGGILLGGPIGFVASLAEVIFKDATGMTPADAAYAAIKDGSSTTALASNADAHAPESLGTFDALAASAPVEPVTAKLLASLAPKIPVVHLATPNDKAVLELYGASGHSAHDSYRKAQLRPYLTDVTVSKML